MENKMQRARVRPDILLEGVLIPTSDGYIDLPEVMFGKQLDGGGVALYDCETNKYICTADHSIDIEWMD
jgi:hypothetical protein